jgi:hypothetical protein
MKAEGAGRTLLSLALVASVAGGVSALRSRLNRRYDAARRILDVAQIPRPLAARVASLGHTEWATDVLWINALIYYGQSLYANLPARYIRQYADTMIELDPRFKRAYSWAATALLYRTVRSTEDDARRAGDYLRQGLTQFPNDPSLHHAYGLNLAFDQAPYKRHGSPGWVALKVEGGQHLALAAFGLSATTERSPWLPLTAAGLLMIGRREREAILTLCDGLIYTDDPDVLAAIEGRLGELLRDRTTEDPRYRASFELVQQRRRHYPWMSPALHVFVGEPVLSPSQR